MFCIYCGGRLPDNANFCPNCGGAVSWMSSPKPPVQPEAPIVSETSKQPVQDLRKGNSYKLTIKRASQFFAINPPMKVYIDTIGRCSIENGGSAVVELSEGHHTIRIVSSIRKKELDVDLRTDMVLSLSWDRVTGAIRADLSENINSPTVAKESKTEDKPLNQAQQASVPMQRTGSEKCWLSISRELQSEHKNDPMVIRIDSTKRCSISAGEYTELELKKGNHTIQVLLTKHQATAQVNLEEDSVLFLGWNESDQEINIFFSAVSDEG